ncbi:MAG: class I SAM-dependent methyltransferase [Actinomycetota bacterium]
MSRDDVRTNLRSWEAESDSYQEEHAKQLNRWDFLGWGTWDVPEDEVHALGGVSGLRALELGCGAAQGGIKVSRRGAHVVGMDFSENQLRHAVENVAASATRMPLVRASAEELPFADGSFDLVFCDHGATSFTDPHLTIPEASRVLRPGGRLVFDISTPVIWMCWPDGEGQPGRQLVRDYFALGRMSEPDDVEWQLTYGEWIRLFRSSGFEVEDLIELRPSEDATTTYGDYASKDWARAFPSEHIWKVRKLERAA